MSAGSRFASASLTCAAAVATALLLETPPALADDVQGTRSEKLRETSHEVRITLHEGYADLVVRRTVHNGGSRHDQALFHIEPPPGAVATGLRTLGSVGGKPHWFDGELMEAEAAAARYLELTGIGGYYPKDPALLSWRHQGLLALQVFPCPPDEDKTVEYTLSMPTRYSGGEHHLSLPAMGTASLLAQVTVRAADRKDRVFADGMPMLAGDSIQLRRDHDLELTLVPHRPPVLDTRLGVVPVADRRVLLRYEVLTASHVSTLPRRPWVVVVLDASRSQRFDDAEASRAAAVAYLSHLGDAKVEVLTYDRRVHRRHGRFVSSARARTDLETLPVDQKNGSNLDLALLEAEQLLEQAPAGAPRRIVAITDGLARSTMRAERLKGALADHDVVTHIGIVSSGAPALERDDEHPWAEAVRPTGGLVWQATARDDAGERAELRRVYEEWARPLRVDRLRFFAPRLPLGTQLDGFEPPPTLAEGEGTEALLFAEREIDSLRAEGELWSEPVSSAATPDADLKKLWAALVFGTERLNELSEPEMMTLATIGGAVSPVTSYLAIEPGVRPSTEGLEAVEGTGQGFGSGHGMVRMAASGVSGLTAPIDRDAFLRERLATAWHTCGGAADTATVSLETTRAEVVDVPSVKLDKGSDPLLEKCLREAAWDLLLPVQFDDAWTVWTVYV